MFYHKELKQIDVSSQNKYVEQFLPSLTSSLAYIFQTIVSHGNISNGVLYSVLDVI